MDWTRALDGYCERGGPGYWAEPINALTNLAFLFAALWLWRDARGLERWLVAALMAVGVGSWLFHTQATLWAALADVAPIALFILLYVFAVHRRLWGWGAAGSAAAVLAFLPYLWLAGRGFAALPGFAISAAYWPVPLAMAGYGAALRHRAPLVGRGLLAGAGLLVVSLVARSLDGPLCAVLPLGTHWIWHLLNAVLLGAMVTLLRRHRVEADPPGR